MKMNKKGEVLYNVWLRKYYEENDKLGGNSEEGEFVDGWYIVDKVENIHNITDKCGILLFGYGEYVFDIIDEWINMGGNQNCIFGYTFEDVKKELLKYFE